jgi:hypothetical protein
MKAAAALAIAIGGVCMMAGALGASLPFSVPWSDVAGGFMAFVFGVSVASFIVGMNVLRAGLDVRHDRDGGVLRLARGCRSIAGLAMATGTVVAIRVARNGAWPVGVALVTSVLIAAGAWRAARRIARGHS